MDGDDAELFVAIVGMAGRFPGAPDLETFWRNLRAGVESIVTFTDDELRAAGVPEGALADPAYVRAGGVLDGADRFDAAFFGYSPHEASLLDPQQRILLECAWEALESAGYDPLRAPGSVGVYAGVGLDTYFLLNLLAHRDTRGAQGISAMAAAILGNDKDFAASRVAYKLDLRGPALTVQTACSTSLVAIHAACQALLGGECDLALAGGVAVKFPQTSGYRYERGGILSPDGHCRAFDADAAGTVNGHGAGVLALKRLSDAIADRDPIRAVLRGSSVNNDGGRKVGFTAPSVEGQAAVIKAAHLAAGVAPETIDYVEAHGTATSLGDPIELAALAAAFGAGARFAIGSVKTNIGHLDVAAGVAGVIKTVLALEHGEIPPSLHFTRPSPAIDLQQMHLDVVASPRPWVAGAAPRRAGVSSFGIGGTNAHVVLEEAPVEGPARDGSPPRATRSAVAEADRPRLVVLSARSEDALEQATDALVRHLEERAPASLADVAYTLHVGRHPFEHRRAVACDDVASAAEALRARDPRRVRTQRAASEGRPVVFLFPGQGAQRPDMAKELRARDAGIRDAIDAATGWLASERDVDIAPHLATHADAARRGEPGVSRIDETSIAQPALFVVEHAVARALVERGVRPSAMFGHSLGEIVAACIAGVMSREDALAFVTERGRIMQALPRGAMTAVSLPSDDVERLLEPGTSVAAINAPRVTTVSGTEPAIAALEARLDARSVAYQRVKASRAFHSEMIDPALPALEAAARAMRLHPPSVPVVSCVTGAWLTEAQATDPAYWASQARATVRCLDGLATALGEATPIAIEIGPGRALASFVRALRGREVQVIAGFDDPSPLATIARLWVAGGAHDAAALYAGEPRRRVALPTYRFQRHRFWIDPPGTAVVLAPPHSGVVGPSAPHARPSLGVAYAPPTSDVEATICEVWQELFGVVRVGVDDDFLELGGHSLLATQLAVRLGDLFEVELDLRSVLEARTVAELALIVEAAVIAQLTGEGDRGPESSGTP